jgi:ribonuclease R
MVNVRSEFHRGTRAKHHGVGAEVYARFSAPMRENRGRVSCTRRPWELLSGDVPPTPRSSRATRPLRDRVVERSNEAKRIQGRINQLAHLYVLDQLFDNDLAPPPTRTARAGTARSWGLTRDKVHVTFEEPPVDVKLYIDDLEEQLRTKVELSDDGASLRRRASGAWGVPHR